MVRMSFLLATILVALPRVSDATRSLEVSLMQVSSSRFKTAASTLVQGNSSSASPPQATQSVAQDRFLYFWHPLKSGGTTLSGQLLDIFGKEALLSGSQSSDYFKWDALDAVEWSEDASAKIRIAFSHTSFEDWLQGMQGHRVRSRWLRTDPLQITLVREPVTWRASQFFEWICWLDKLADPADLAACRFNLTKLATKRPSMETLRRTPLFGQAENDFSFCASVSNFIHSDFYSNWGSGLTSKSYGICQNVSGSACTEEALAKFNNMPWFGVTEYMDASVCLLREALGKADMPGTVQKERYKQCRPIDVWPDEEQRLVRSWESGRDMLIYETALRVLHTRLAESTLCAQHLARV